MNGEHTKPRPLILLLALLMGLQPILPAIAAEGKQEGAAEPAREEAAGDRQPVEPEVVDPEVVDPAQDRPKKPAPGDDPSVFIPTEEISEDFAVSFPVDI